MKPAVQCEMQVMNWGESATAGAWVKFWVDSPDLDAFRAIKCRSGKSAGQRFAAVLVEIGDDEQPIAYQNETTASQQAKQAPSGAELPPNEKKPKGGPLARLAGQWCNDELFRHWMGATTPEEAAENIRYACGVRSRSELDHNEEAAAEFHRCYRLPFREYCREMGVEL